MITIRVKCALKWRDFKKREDAQKHIIRQNSEGGSSHIQSKALYINQITMQKMGLDKKKTTILVPFLNCCILGIIG